VVEEPVHECLEHGRLDQSIVAEDEDLTGPLVRGNVEKAFKDKVDEQGGIFSA